MAVRPMASRFSREVPPESRIPVEGARSAPASPHSAALYFHNEYPVIHLTPKRDLDRNLCERVESMAAPDAWAGSPCHGPGNAKSSMKLATTNHSLPTTVSWASGP